VDEVEVRVAKPIISGKRRDPMNIVNVGYRSTNYYVIANSAPKLLVDAGWPGTFPAMEHSCSRMGIR
jgi:hypothetical protein